MWIRDIQPKANKSLFLPFRKSVSKLSALPFVKRSQYLPLEQHWLENVPHPILCAPSEGDEFHADIHPYAVGNEAEWPERFQAVLLKLIVEALPLF